MKAGRTQKLMLNAMGAAIYQIVNAICGIIIPRFLLLAYGSSLNGLVSSITQFLSSLAVVEAGLALAAQQSMYKPLAEKNYKKLSKIVSATRICYNHVGILFTSLTAVLAFIYPVVTEKTSLSYLETVILVFVLSANYVLSFFIISKYQALFQADQKVYVISLSKAIARIVNALIIILLSSNNVNIVLMRTIALLSLFVQTFIIWGYAKKNYAHIDYYAKPDFSALNQRWDAMFLQILGSVTVSAPAIILTFVSTLDQVSIYSIYNMVFAALMGILGIFINGINASFGSLLQSASREKVKIIYAEFENLYYVFISIVYLTTMIMITPFIRIYTNGISDTNYLLPGLGILFTANAVAYNIKTPQGMMVQAAGLFRKTRLQNILQAAILLIAGVILGKFWGIYGMLIASILSNGYRCIDLAIFIPKNVTFDTSWKSIRRILILGITIVGAYFPGKWLVETIMIQGYFEWIIVAVGIFIYSMIVITTVDSIFERDNFKASVVRLVSMFKRREKSEK